MGLSQGSVLSPILLNLFIQDIYKQVRSERVKFADDGTIWNADTRVNLLAQSLEADLKHIKERTKQWRMKTNVEKNRFLCVFKEK